MYIFGFEAMQYSSGTSWTLSVLVVLISTSTTAQLLGGSFVLFFNDTAALLCSSLVSATVFPLMVSTKELCLVQCTPAACCFAKSTPNMRLLVKFSQTRKVCCNLFFPISISQLILLITPKLVPFALTTVGKFFVSKSLLSSFNFQNVSPDITLLDGPVSNSVNTSLFAMLILNMVPRSDPKVSSILHISVGSEMLVKYSSVLYPLGSHA